MIKINIIEAVFAHLEILEKTISYREAYFSPNTSEILKKIEELRALIKESGE